MPHWADLLDLPPLPWTDNGSASAAAQRLQTLGARITAIDPTPFDRSLLWFYSDVYLPLRSALRRSRQAPAPATPALTIVLPGHGVLCPGQIATSGLLDDPGTRAHALALFQAANRACGLDLYAFHVPDATPDRDAFHAELVRAGATDAALMAETRRRHPTTNPAYHFEAAPHGVVSLVDAVLRIDYLLRHWHGPIRFLTISAGIFAAMYASLDLPFEEVCRFSSHELMPHIDDFEIALTRDALVREGGTAPDLLVRESRPGMLAIGGLPSTTLRTLAAACNAEFATDIEIGVRMSPVLHIAVGLRPHLYAFAAFIRRRLGRFASGGLPVRFRLLPVTHGSHHSASAPVRDRLSRQLRRLLAMHPGDRLKHPIFYVRPGQDPACYETVEELYEGVLAIIDRPVDFTGCLQDAFRLGCRRFVVASSGASSFSGRMMQANIDEAAQEIDISGIDVHAPDDLAALKALAATLSSAG
jgi:hypothetical protein